jgi:hypothetical protein
MAAGWQALAIVTILTARRHAARVESSPCQAGPLELEARVGYTSLISLHSQIDNWEIATMMGHSVLVALATMAAAADTEVASLSRGQLAAGQKFEIRTTDRVFRGQMVDPTSGQCRLATSADGENFTPPRTVYLLGSTAGSQDRQMLVVMHEVQVGKKLELGLDDLERKHRHITSDVTAIKLE